MKKYSLITFLFFLILVCSNVVTAEENDVLDPETWPVTVENTVNDILSSMSEESKKVVKGTPKDDLIKFHHGWGMCIRNYYGLWRGNEKLIKSACGKPCHPDDASMIMIEAVWDHLQK